MADNLTSFIVGDSDLVFLGLAAVLERDLRCAASAEADRSQSHPQSDGHALRLLGRGTEAGASFPLDDVPDLLITVKGDRDAILRLRELASSLDAKD